MATESPAHPGAARTGSGEDPAGGRHAGESYFALEAALEGLGQELVLARSGTEALRHLLEDDFAAVLLDVKMPDMDGFQTAELIRSRKRSRHTPILFLTGLQK